ncbi:MAG TPA: c(7)-type cytochrome triheme domain-containing protein [Polyangia bacterium]|nr:c(7)-type cytochrome triheme domain-containing protein [Polyangia bacterium]HVZ75421.1 c(7)-type cytochrome triheme domain-containing protein [Polyangia bacterium]
MSRFGPRRARGLARGLVVAALLTAAAALGAAFPATLRIPRRDPKAAPALPAALFSHRAHASMGCQVCHPSVFPQAPTAFAHDDMKAGRYCGACHDGGVAFAIAGAACGGCHAPRR